ncbi:acyltransferase family protein [Aliiroseovarius crassostreae]|uniref:acyltransferase family protein n=1 Tax=Aliiroseovarius crassostreae TaxID=154981 RepID=UPI003C7C823B
MNAGPSKPRFPGFDILRIFAALLVVFSHSFLIAEHSEANEPAQALTGEIFGVYGVMIFFVLSGFLITDSAIRSSSSASFWSKRLRRILPGFVVCNIVVMLGVAPFYARVPLAEFLTHPEVWTQLLSTLGFASSSLYLPDLIQIYDATTEEALMLPIVLNGVLWTIRLELACYALVGGLMLLGLLRPAMVLVVLVFALTAALAYGWQINEFLIGFYFLLPSFAVGMVFRLFCADVKVKGGFALTSLAILVSLSLQVDNWHLLAPVLFAPLCILPLIWVGQQDNQVFDWLRQYGDPSYGIYLWGWPLQQVLRAALGEGYSGYGFAALSMPLALAAGYLSWHVIEKPFLRHRRVLQAAQA